MGTTSTSQPFELEGVLRNPETGEYESWANDLIQVLATQDGTALGSAYGRLLDRVTIMATQRVLCHSERAPVRVRDMQEYKQAVAATLEWLRGLPEEARAIRKQGGHTP